MRGNETCIDLHYVTVAVRITQNVYKLFVKDATFMVYIIVDHDLGPMKLFASYKYIYMFVGFVMRKHVFVSLVVDELFVCVRAIRMC